MARAKGKTDQSASEVWTNVTKNPLILADGSMVGPGEQTEFEDEGWIELGALVSGAPKLSEAGTRKLEELQAENETLRQELFEEKAKSEQLSQELEALKNPPTE